MEIAEEIVGLMATIAVNQAGQLALTRYRVALVEHWRIAPGMRILEIACGQGGMTAVLAWVVGPEGHVIAVDSADPSYGAPMSLGDSGAYLKASPLGSRIDFRYQVDVLDLSVSFPDDAFDAIVFAHGAWYFASFDHLRRTLERIRPWSKRLCFAEWDLTPETTDQIAHFLAVTIQGEIEAYKTVSEANVRTPFPLSRFVSLLNQTGWDLSALSRMNTESLQDGMWEVDLCLDYALPEAATLDIPPRIQDLIIS